jgi:serine/threonine protein kinase/formylglycine-generating enzyme required for sulfatase activity
VQEIFESVVGRPDAERAALLDDACGNDGALRDEVEALLKAHDEARGFLEAPTSGGAETAVTTASPPREGRGTVIGRYKLLERLGEGGFGAVWMAEQKSPVRRRVALKIIKLGMDTEQVIARFEAERQALAMMDHPNIAKVFDAGTTEAGRPYFVMELIKGVPIVEYCDTEKLDTHRRLDLFVEVCNAIQHAHHKGVIHRDIKPGNVLVTLHDGVPVPKVIDFGIAKATNAELTARTLFTEHHQVLGTPAYMSPEQAEMSGLDIDSRTDVYSLGVLLYELLTGTTPFTTKELVRQGLAEMMRIIREDEPQKPSTRLSSLGETATRTAAQQQVDVRRLGVLLRGDLDWIVMKCLEKERRRRYETASELAADVRRHLDDEPVTASPPSARYRLAKLVRRHRTGVIAAAIAAAALALGGAAAIVGALQVRDAEATARALRPQADEFRARLLLEQADELWPPHPVPETVETLEGWQGAARELVVRLPGYRARLAESGTQADSVADRSTRELLAKLVAQLEQLSDDGGLLAADAVVPGRGWSVPRRLSFARKLATDFAEGGSAARAWAAAREAIPTARADLDGDGVLEEAYPGLDLAPQPGLLPLGPDPDSGLWEFAHIMTGDPPERDASGALVLTEDTGVVLVLIPGGTFLMGADGGAGPRHEVTLSPYFISKHEMTQGQWKRLTGDNPSAYGPDAEWELDWLASGEPPSLLHPVEQVTWRDADTWLRRAGLALPSEAQWERATRAGTQTRFSTGPDLASLRGAANLRDVRFAEAEFEFWGRYETGFDDGSVVHWAVGSGRPNGFGLHDVHGNVWEWCLDGYAPYPAGGSGPRLNPVVPTSSDARYVYRGGSFRFMRGAAGSAIRFFDPPDRSGSALGVRPARTLTP